MNTKPLAILLLAAALSACGDSDDKNAANVEESGVLDKAKSMVEKTTETASNMSESAGESIGNAMDSAEQTASNAMESTGSAMDSAKHSASNAMDAAKDSAGNALEAGKDMGTAAMEGAEGAMESAKESIASTVDAGMEKAAGLTGTSVDSTEELASSATDSTAATASSAVAGIATAAGGNPADYDAEMGESVYKGQCFACHGTGAAGAPKMGDAAAWEPRIAQGNDVLISHSINGFQGSKGVMPAKGGFMSLSDEQVSAAAMFMVNNSK